MLTAVKSLRLVVGRGATLYGVVVILVRVWMGGRVRREPSWGSALSGGVFGEGGEFGGANAEPRDPGRVGRDA